MSIMVAHHGYPVVLGLTVMLGLSGCANTGSGYAVLDREAEAGDALPADLPAYAYEDLVVESVRFVGEHDENRLYLARGTNSAICVVVYPGNANWVVSCGGGGQLGLGGPSGNYVVIPDGAAPPEGAAEVTSNIFAVE